MLTHPNFDPVAFQLGPLAVHWYGLMYVCGFVSAYLLWLYRIRTYPRYADANWNADRISDLIFYGALGAVIGGRLGYVLFYKPAYYLNNLTEVVFIQEGGMSFHGGLLGVICALYLFSRKINLPFLQVADFVAPVAPIGLFFGRMGNFINQELWGKTTDLPWGMIFSNGGPLPRHPSMVYEAILEGLLLLAIIWLVARKERAFGTLSGLFLIGYSLSRMLVELVRVPDQHLNYLLFDWVTMGQVLSLPMLLLGLFLVFKTNR
ncbi:prolipoprotein diacylglyceryl transferase [Arenicella xantha]|uniref:Phosphatidylglycerol--prolipoprotein diacylglyceryl transferase n=1 Tax=Arenicella xantha TaxID=644221 RepID=A0A395JK92_9GAMM|nr:prolipoprotein diacylglyceryl transferase [Arenicella xantha]RBP49641.1 prolipoprotein diacylglyceryl transferase [Arenicella xantha]